MNWRYCIGWAVCLTWAGFVAADPPMATPRPFWQCWLYRPLCPPVGCCPDDYARKPYPSIYQVGHCGGVDDYCRKPIPSVPLTHCGGPDDYCRKPLPTLLCPPPSPYLQCGGCEGPRR